MILSEIDFFTYNIPIKPVSIKGEKITRRTGFIVRLTDQNNFCGYSECAPLPNFHKEDMSVAEKQLLFFREHFMNYHFKESILRLDGALENEFGVYHFAPVVRFAIESALLNLIAVHKDRPLPELLNPNYKKQINVNGLLSGFGENQSKDLLEQNYTHLKIKVGNDIDNDAEFVNVVISKLENQTISLDANQKWSVAEAIKFCSKIDVRKITYIEEPVDNLKNLSEFYKQTNMPFALDESLAEKKMEKLLKTKGLNTLVLKPSLLGLEKSVLLAKHAKANNLNAVFSSCFETGLGLSMIAQCAACFGTENNSAGLDTWRWLQEDIVDPTFSVSNGKLNIDDFLRQKIATKNLEPVVLGW